MPPTHRLAAPDGWPLAVHEPWPAPSHARDPPIPVLHALALCGRAYQPALAALATSRRVLFLDLRGHGDSVRKIADDGDAPAWATTSTALWNALASDVASVVASLHLTPCDVVAHSLGGGAAALAASRHGIVWRRAWLFEPPRWPLVVGRDGRDLASDNARFAAAAAAVDVTFASVDEAEALLSIAHPFKWFDARVRAAFCGHGGLRVDGSTVALTARPSVVAAVAVALMGEGGAPRDDDYSAMGGGLAVGVGPERGGVTSFLRSGAIAAAEGAGARLVNVAVSPAAAGHYGVLVDPIGVGREIAGWVDAGVAKL